MRKCIWFIGIIFALQSVSCIYTQSNDSNLEDIRTVFAEIIYIEPIPFIESGELMIPYKQPTWIKVLGSNDSLAVLFDYTISRGEDVSKKFSLNKPYKFLLKKYKFPETSKEQATYNQINEKDTDSVLLKILSAPVRNLLDSTKAIISDEYWLVLSINNP